MEFKVRFAIQHPHSKKQLATKGYVEDVFDKIFLSAAWNLGARWFRCSAGSMPLSISNQSMKPKPCPNPTSLTARRRNDSGGITDLARGHPQDLDRS